MNISKISNMSLVTKLMLVGVMIITPVRSMNLKKDGEVVDLTNENTGDVFRQKSGFSPSEMQERVESMKKDLGGEYASVDEHKDPVIANMSGSLRMLHNQLKQRVEPTRYSSADTLKKMQAEMTSMFKTIIISAEKQDHDAMTKDELIEYQQKMLDYLQRKLTINIPMQDELKSIDDINNYAWTLAGGLDIDDAVQVCGDEYVKKLRYEQNAERKYQEQQRFHEQELRRNLTLAQQSSTKSTRKNSISKQKVEYKRGKIVVITIGTAALRFKIEENIKEGDKNVTLSNIEQDGAKYVPFNKALQSSKYDKFKTSCNKTKKFRLSKTEWDTLDVKEA